MYSDKKVLSAGKGFKLYKGEIDKDWLNFIYTNFYSPQRMQL